jgi:hypothetical protein
MQNKTLSSVTYKNAGPIMHKDRKENKKLNNIRQGKN